MHVWMHAYIRMRMHVCMEAGSVGPAAIGPEMFLSCFSQLRVGLAMGLGMGLGLH